MKKILVKNQVEGGKLPLIFLKRALQQVLKPWAWATGSSPIALYQEMVESDVDFRSFIVSIGLSTSD